MERYFDLRTDPTKLVPGAKTVISLMYNYYTDDQQKDEEAPRISIYAYGKDYHQIIKDKLRSLLEFIRLEIGEVSGRCFVDSAPVMEREWARRSGLGWLGKNTLLIHPDKGSYYFLAEIILDLELSYNQPIRDHCGSCRNCIDACPTEAISPEGYILDASKCISYFTIELRDEIPSDVKGKFENWMFGCDICQEVCPWNRFAEVHDEPQFKASEELLGMNKRDWEELTQEVFSRVFKKSAVKRTKFKGLKRNIKFLDPEA